MAVHLTRIYTKTGDDGTTALGDMSRVAKTDVRVAAYADSDETNASIGVALALADLPEAIATVLSRVQKDLFDVGADLCTPIVVAPKYPPLRVTEDYVTRLEGWCDEFNAELPMPSPEVISRICQKVLPAMVAFTRTFAPMPERLDTVPTHFTFNQ